MNWDRDRLLMNLSEREQSWAGGESPGFKKEFQEYCRFYGFNFVEHDTASQHHIRIVDAENYTITAQRITPVGDVKAVTVLTHGYFDHAGLYRHVIDFLLSRGQEVVVFDLPGHGLSSGSRVDIRDFSEYTECLDAIFRAYSLGGRKVNLIGQSTGAAIIADYLLLHRDLTEGPDIGATVLLAPLLKPCAWTLAEVMHTLLRTRKEYWPRSLKKNSHDEAFLAFVKNEDPMQWKGLSFAWIGALRKWIPAIQKRAPSDRSIVIIQGREDSTVEWEFNMPAYRKLFPLAKVTLLDDAKHHLVNEAFEYREKVFREIGRYI